MHIHVVAVVVVAAGNVSDTSLRLVMSSALTGRLTARQVLPRCIRGEAFSRQRRDRATLHSDVSRLQRGLSHVFTMVGGLSVYENVCIYEGSDERQ